MPYRSTPLGSRYNGMFNNQVDGTVDYYENGTLVLSLDSTGLTIGNSDPYTLPLVDGAANEILKTDGAGTVDWAADAVA